MLKYLRLIFSCGFRILHDYFKWMLRYARHPERYPFKERYDAVRGVITFSLKKMRISMKVDGLEIFNSQTGSCVLVSNHLSMIDILSLIALSEKPLSFISKKEVYRYPFVGKCLRALEGGFIDRKDLRQNVAVLAEAEKRLQANYCSYVIYPEGHRGEDPFGPLQTFHPGSFKIAYRSGVPVIAMAEFGTFRILDRKSNFKSFPFQFKFFPPYLKGDYEIMPTTEFAPLLQKKIEDELDNMKKNDQEYFFAKKEKSYPPEPQWWKVYLRHE